jgi:hypothetical protein
MKKEYIADINDVTAIRLYRCCIQVEKQNG